MKKPHYIVLATAAVTAIGAAAAYVINHKDEIQEGINDFKKKMKENKEENEKIIEEITKVMAEAEEMTEEEMQKIQDEEE